MSTQQHSLVWDGQPDHQARRWQYYLDGWRFVGPCSRKDAGTGPVAKCYDLAYGPAPAGGKDNPSLRSPEWCREVEHRLGLMSAKIHALESHPAMSVPEVKVPGHSVTEVDSINLQALHTTAIKCGMTNAYRGSLLQRIRARMEDLHADRIATDIDAEPQPTPAIEVPGHQRVTTSERCQQTPGSFHHDPAGGALTINPSSPQRTPAEVEGGESVGRRYARTMIPTCDSGAWIASHRGWLAGCTSIAPKEEGLLPIWRESARTYIADAIDHALSTAPRGKVPSRDSLKLAVRRALCIEREPNGPPIDNIITDAILALFTEGNARG